MYIVDILTLFLFDFKCKTMLLSFIFFFLQTLHHIQTLLSFFLKLLNNLIIMIGLLISFNDRLFSLSWSSLKIPLLTLLRCRLFTFVFLRKRKGAMFLFTNAYIERRLDHTLLLYFCLGRLVSQY